METIGPMGFTFGRYLIGAGVIIPLALYEARKVNLLHAQEGPKPPFRGIWSGPDDVWGLRCNKPPYLHQCGKCGLFNRVICAVGTIIAAFLLRRHANKYLASRVVIDGGKLFAFGTSSLDAQFGDLLIIGGAFLGWPYFIDPACS